MYAQDLFTIGNFARNGVSLLMYKAEYLSSHTLIFFYQRAIYIFNAWVGSGCHNLLFYYVFSL